MLVKPATTVEISTVVAVISFLKKLLFVSVFTVFSDWNVLIINRGFQRKSATSTPSDLTISRSLSISALSGVQKSGCS